MQKYFTNFLILLFITAFSQTQAIQCNQGQVSVNGVCQTNNLDQLSNIVTIYGSNQLQYQIQSDNTIDFLLSYTHTGYFSIGFGSSMRNLDLVYISIYNNEVIVLDYNVNGHNDPSLDSQQDYSIKGYEIGSSSVKVKFNRKLNTGDSKDKVLDQQGQKWCFGDNSESQAFVEHSKYGTFLVFGGSATILQLIFASIIIILLALI